MNPLELDLAAAREAEAGVGLLGTPSDRARRLLRWFHQTRSAFTYSLESKTAREAYATRRGDCFSVTNLFIAFARRLGIDARYSYVRDVRHFVKNDSFYASSHIAAAVIDGANSELLDFERDAPEHLLASYRVIPDEEAIALFNSNLVMSDLAPGKLERAETIMRFFARTVPTLPEIDSNLSVVLLRRGKTAEALALLEVAAAKYPTYAPIFTNGLVASMRAGDETKARAFADGGAEAAKRDPVFAFTQGMHLFEQGHYEQALEYFERAESQDASNPLVLSYVVRVQIARGAAREALETFTRAWRGHPGDANLERLRAEHPELAD